ncbi:MAG: T9SS type A sorting domain-containing protein [Vicingaceae bacterium]|nr:T9SS type A sorting domain-containing protein [Vicingaceae bacterium]
MKKLLFLIPLIYANSFFAQNTAIPDANFEQALINLGLDTAPIDGFVATANIDTVIFLDVWSKSISDLTGIEDFVALEGLDCGANPISNLDLSQNLNLKALICNINFQITSLDLSKNTALTYLNCSWIPQLVFLDVRNGNNANFTYFDAMVDTNLTCIYVDDKNASYLSSWIKDNSAYWVNDTLDCQNVTSLNEYKIKDNSFNIYPNPATNYAYFEFENLPAELTIYNTQQRVIFKEQIETKTYKLALGGFEKGVYLCGVFGDNTINKLIII